AKLRVGLAEELDCDAREAVAQGEESGSAPGMGQSRKTMGGDAHDQEEHQTFQDRLVQLARMARNLQRGGGQAHRPGHIPWPAIELAVDEIGEPPETEAYWRRGRAQIQ